MKGHRNVVLMIGALAMTAIFAGTANAQQAIAKDARFTLPFQATWADTILPAGDYTLSVVRRAEDRGMLYAVTIAGAGKKKTILAFQPLGPRASDRSMLVVESRGEIHTIRGLRLSKVDLVLAFPESKAERELVAKGTETMQSVPILLAAK